MTAVHLFGVIFLVSVNAFFSATEFSLVAVRLSRIRELVERATRAPRSWKISWVI